MTDKIATALAANIPPMELDHKAALELLYQQEIREMGEPDFEAMVRHYREARRQDAARHLEREIKRRAAADKKAQIAARKAAKTQSPDKANPPHQGGGEGDPT